MTQVEQEKLRFPPPSNLCSNNYQPSPNKNLLFDDPARDQVKEEKEEQGTSREGAGGRGSVSFPV